MKKKSKIISMKNKHKETEKDDITALKDKIKQQKEALTKIINKYSSKK